jgi:hypothetical protein
MKLIYTYIHNFRNIQQQQFNFCSDYKIDLKFEKNIENQFYNPFLEIEKVKNNLPHLFNENISLVTGVIGENGSGKSSLISYFTFEMHDHIYDFEGILINYDIIIFEKIIDEEKKIFIEVGKSWDQINLKNKDEINVEVTNNSNIKWETLLNTNNDFKIIHYSNIYDRKIEDSANDLLNISTNYLSMQDVVSYANEHTQISQTTAHRMMELKRQLVFAVNFEEKLPFKLPDNLNINKNDVAFNALNNKLNLNKGPFIDRISDWIKTINKISTENKAEGFDKDLFFLQTSYFNHLINDLAFTRGFKDFIENYDDFVNDIILIIINEYKIEGKQIEFVKLLAEIKILEGKTIITQIGKSINDESNISIEEKIRKFSMFEDKLNELLISKSDFNLNKLSIKLSDSLEILKLYERTVQIIDYLDFSLPSLSTGELGLLTLFSRFYDLVYEPEKYKDFKIDNHINDLIIFIY